jgi:hypothetical protein
LSLSIKYDIFDAELIEKKQECSTLKYSTEALIQELKGLQKVTRNMKGMWLAGQEKQDPLDLVSRTTDENKGLVEATAEIQTKAEEIEAWIKTIVDKCDSQVQKAVHARKQAESLNHTKAVYTTERLHKEIEALKSGEGRQTFHRTGAAAQHDALRPGPWS